MKAKKLLFVLVALLVAGAGNAWADRRVYGSVGVYVGPGAYWGPGYARPYYYPRPYGYPGPYLYSDPYYTPAPVVVVPSAPPVYIEQQGAVVAPAPDADRQYWYYCSSSKKYYPYAKECPGGWQKVLPQPAQ
ncbi:MAG: hypothetical protein WCA83_08785 [Azonexus sp.]